MNENKAKKCIGIFLLSSGIYLYCRPIYRRYIKRMSQKRNLHNLRTAIISSACLDTSSSSSSSPSPSKGQAAFTVSPSVNSNSGVYYNAQEAPAFAQKYFTSDNIYRRVLLREWEDLEWRKAAGWLGRDYIHGEGDGGVKVRCYFYNHSERSLTGVVEFSKNCESHRGLCHGGSMTSLFDDILGHLAFIYAGTKPWDGATVKVNCDLMKPVRIGSVLEVSGRVTRRERKKVFIEAVLREGELQDGKEVVYARMEGICLQPVEMSTVGDEVDKRVFLTDGKGPILDTGWLSPLSRL